MADPAPVIGPSFYSEIVAAGLLGLPFTWSTAGVERGAGLSDADWARVQAVVAAHDPTKPEPITDIPDISDRQFARGLWGDGIITYADFLGFIGPGTIPAPIQAIVNQLPDDDTGAPTPRKDAVGFLTGSKLYSFSHPLVEFFRQALLKNDPKWTVDYLRQQWLLWATL